MEAIKNVCVLISMSLLLENGGLTRIVLKTIPWDLFLLTLCPLCSKSASKSKGRKQRKRPFFFTV